jgi:hypothetical protein
VKSEDSNQDNPARSPAQAANVHANTLSTTNDKRRTERRFLLGSNAERSTPRIQ